MADRTIELRGIYKIPSVPNFLIRADGEGSLDVSTLYADEVEAIGEAWTKALLENVRKRRVAEEVRAMEAKP